jgi:hypothetical protein
MAKTKNAAVAREAANYTHPKADLALCPEVGTQAQFKSHKPSQTYRYASSLSPVLEWDGQNPAREQGEALIARMAECGVRVAELAKQPAYNGRVFHVTQGFFPRTGAWESVNEALKGDYDETMWDHLAGTVSAPFTPGVHREVAVKVIDDRGNELLVAKKLEKSK